MWHQLANAVPQYGARATLVLDDAILRLDPFGARLRARVLSQVQLATEVEVMRSREFAAMAAAKLLPGDVPGKEARPAKALPTDSEDGIDFVLDSFQITWHPTTLAIDIHSRADSPDSAALIANVVAQTYLDYTLDSQLAHVNRTVGSVLSRRSALLEKMKAAETELVDFISLHNLDDPSETITLTDRLEKLEAQLALANAGPSTPAAVEALRVQRDQTRAELDDRAAAGIQRKSFELALDTMRRQDNLLSDQIEALGLQQALLTPSAQQVTIATSPDEPLSPSPKTELAGALIGGLTLGFIAALFGESVRGRLHWPQQVAGFRSPVLGRLPLLPRNLIKRTAETAGSKRLDRAWRRLSPLCSVLRTMAATPTGALVLVTSPGKGEGRSTLSFAMAVHAAAEGDSVLLVDLDPSPTDITTNLSQERAANVFFDLLCNPLQLDAAARKLPEHPGLSVLAPSPGVSPLRFRNSAQALEAVRVLRHKFSLIVVDCPPLVNDDTVLRFGSHADLVVLVARTKKTRYDTLSEAARQLELNRFENIGIVVNDG